MKFAHTNIICKDWKKLTDFYINTFQCTIQPPQRKQSGEWLALGTGVKNAKLEGVHLRLPGYDENGPTLEIYQYEEFNNNSVNAPNTLGFAHIAFEVDDVHAVVSAVIKNGGKKFGAIVSRKVPGVGEITFTYAQDPEGNFLEIQQWDKKNL